MSKTKDRYKLTTNHFNIKVATVEDLKLIESIKKMIINKTIRKSQNKVFVAALVRGLKEIYFYDKNINDPANTDKFNRVIDSVFELQGEIEKLAAGIYNKEKTQTEELVKKIVEQQNENLEMFFRNTTTVLEKQIEQGKANEEELLQKINNLEKEITGIKNILQNQKKGFFK